MVQGPFHGRVDGNPRKYESFAISQERNGKTLSNGCQLNRWHWITVDKLATMNKVKNKIRQKNWINMDNSVWQWYGQNGWNWTKMDENW